MIRVLLVAIPFALLGCASGLPHLMVMRVDDFTISGNGSDPAWKRTDWTSLRKRAEGGVPYEARFKVLYSGTGVYFLMEGSDAKVTASLEADFLNLWTEDVYEAFLWTDERDPAYFEYEISPLGYELPILVPNFGEGFMGWIPWNYDGERRILKKTATSHGAAESGKEIKSWSAEFFIPYELLKPLRNVPPLSGTHWRANFYRMDYDGEEPASWDWARVGPSFHEYRKFGILVFE